MLCEALNGRGMKTMQVSFPSRDTTTGKAISEYLAGTASPSARDLHLLFAENRRERVPDILGAISAGITVITDRYSYSGVAYSVARGLPIEWCQASEVGLPQPDMVILLDVDAETAVSRFRADESRECSETLQNLRRVARIYRLDELVMPHDSWLVANGRLPMQELHELILDHTIPAIAAAATAPLGYYGLPGN
jgi:dTMP kinase